MSKSSKKRTRDSWVRRICLEGIFVCFLFSMGAVTAVLAQTSLSTALLINLIAYWGHRLFFTYMSKLETKTKS